MTLAVRLWVSSRKEVHAFWKKGVHLLFSPQYYFTCHSSITSSAIAVLLHLPSQYYFSYNHIS